PADLKFPAVAPAEGGKGRAAAGAPAPPPRPSLPAIPQAHMCLYPPGDVRVGLVPGQVHHPAVPQLAATVPQHAAAVPQYAAAVSQHAVVEAPQLPASPQQPPPPPPVQEPEDMAMSPMAVSPMYEPPPLPPSVTTPPPPPPGEPAMWMPPQVQNVQSLLCRYKCLHRCASDLPRNASPNIKCSFRESANGS
ncbi:hypothetical protein DUNSADRAFT_18348, partial [Dunaliella salina]